MSRSKLWIAWVVTGLQALTFFALGVRDLSVATMAACVVLGWMAYATPRDQK